MRKKATFGWLHNLFFPCLPSELKLRACGFHASYDRKLERWHPDSDRDAYRNQLRGLAVEMESVREFYTRSSALYFQFFHSSPVRSKLVNHCANLCVLSPWQLWRTFGDHRLILSVRDPRAVFCSLERHRPARFTERTIPAFCRAWARSVQRYHLGDASVVSFRFEDLVSDPEKVMRSVCRDVGIAFDEVLLSPTHLGRPAKANTSFSRKDGIDPSAVDSWRSHLGDRARRTIEARLRPLLQRLGYV